MRLVWLLAVGLLVAGCASQEEPAPPPAEEEDGDGEPPDGDDTEDEANDTTEPGDGSDEDTTRTNDTDEGEAIPMQIDSPAFADGDPVPEKHSKEEGENTSPPLNVSDVPDAAESLALIVDDPDAGDEPIVHWLIWNIPPQADTIAEGYPPSGDGEAFAEARQGTNGFGNERYDGPAPPPSHDAHRYRFQLFALDRVLDVEEGAQRAELENAMDGAVLANATLTGTYER